LPPTNSDAQSLSKRSKKGRRKNGLLIKVINKMKAVQNNLTLFHEPGYKITARFKPNDITNALDILQFDDIISIYQLLVICRIHGTME